MAELANVRSSSLVVGIGILAGGVLLFINHKREIDEVVTSEVADRIKAFEMRKFRRRAIISSMIVSVGLMMAALYWVNEQRVFAIFILMILALLVGISGLALIDFFSISLQQIGTPDKAAEKALLEEHLRQRKLLERAREEEDKPS